MTTRKLLTASALALALCGAPGAATALGDGSPKPTIAAAAKVQDKPAGRRGGGSIVIGEGVDGSLSGRGATYTFDGRAGQRIRVSLTSDDFDTVLRLTGPGGFELENDDEPGGSLNSLIDARLPADGRYELVVSSYADQGSGAFRLATMDPVNPASGEVRAIALGEPVRGLLARSDERSMTGQLVDYYAFAGSAGQRVTFDLGSDEIDTALTVYLPDGRQESNDDFEFPDSTNSRMSITLPIDGTYHVAASSFGREESGRYTLSLSDADPAIRTVRPSSGTSRVYALSVGVADYERMSPLTRTDDDANRVLSALRQTGALAPESVALTNAQATRAAFESSLASLTSAMGEDDLLLIFYSGHGDKTEGVTTERDGSAETMELFDQVLYDYELAAMLSDFDGRLLLVMDSCFAGGFDQVIDTHDERMGIFSSDADTLSLVASGNKSGGYISHVFRSALEGGADLDRDDAVTAGELGEYMRREFYRMVLEEPLATDAEDFRNARTPGWQHIVVDRGGDGMPHSQVLMNFGSVGPARVARAD